MEGLNYGKWYVIIYESKIESEVTWMGELENLYEVNMKGYNFIEMCELCVMVNSLRKVCDVSFRIVG